MSDNPIRLGALVLPEHQGPEGLGIWRRLERVGFAHAWTFDHVSWRGLRNGPWFDAMATLAGAAAATERIMLGTLVTTPNFRHPVTVATQAMTIDHLSGGRFTLGLGAGVEGADSDVLGATPLSAGERSCRFAEFVHLLDRLLCQPVTSHHGRFFAAVEARTVPGCVQRPRVPFAIAAVRHRGMRLAARYGQIWVTYGPLGDPADFSEDEAFAALRRQVDAFTAVCHAIGRDAGSVRTLVHLSRVVPHVCTSYDRIVDALGRCAAFGFTDVVIAYPRPSGVFAGNPRLLERVAEELAGERING